MSARWCVVVEPVPSVKLVSSPMSLLGALAWFLASWLRLTPASVERWTPPALRGGNEVSPDRLDRLDGAVVAILRELARLEHGEQVSPAQVEATARRLRAAVSSVTPGCDCGHCSGGVS